MTGNRTQENAQQFCAPPAHDVCAKFQRYAIILSVRGVLRSSSFFPLILLGERALAYIFSSFSASAAKCDRRVTRLPLMQQEDQQNHHESVAFGAWAEHKVGRLPRKLSRSDLARKPYYNIKEKQAAGLSLGITTRDTAWR